MRRILLALIALFIATPALADTWTVGQQPVVYPTDRFSIIGDGSTTWGGTPPYFATMPADIPTTEYQLADFSTSDVNVQSPGPGLGEAKFRTTCGTPSHFGYDDPILYPNQPGASHLHMFFGNTLTNAFSNYRSLRTTGRSNCGGDVFNRTAYWAPALLTTVNGKTMALRADGFVIYYTENPNTGSIHNVDIPRDFAYVAGPDPMTGYVNPNIAEAAAANAASIAAGGKMRYSPVGNNGSPDPTGSDTYTGFVGWKCETPIGDGTTQWSPHLGAGTRQPYLKDANGHPTLNCQAGPGRRIIAEFNGPNCWDGVNGHGGPNGRGHIRYPIFATDTSTGETKGVCPDHWYAIPKLIMTIFLPYVTAGEELNWKWASDINTNYAYKAGETGHIDWFGAWHYGTNAQPGVMLRWMRFCLGTMGNAPHECDYSTIDNLTRMKVDSTLPMADPPGSLRPLVNRVVDDGHNWGAQGMKRYVPLPKGPYTMHMH